MSESPSGGYSYTGYSYSYSDYSYSSSEDTGLIDQQIELLKNKLVDMKNYYQVQYWQPMMVTQQQPYATASTQHSSDVVEITKAALKTALENQAQLLQNYLPQSRFKDQGQDMYYPEQEKQLSSSLRPTTKQELSQSLNSPMRGSYSLKQYLETSKIIDEQNDAQNAVNYQYQKQILQLQQQNDKYTKDLQQYVAKLDDREDIIRNLARILKKKDPSFNISNVFQSKQLLEQMERVMSSDPHVEGSAGSRQPPNSGPPPYYQLDAQQGYRPHAAPEPRVPEAQTGAHNREKVMKSGIQFDMDDGVPFSPRQAQRGRPGIARAEEQGDDARRCREIAARYHRSSISLGGAREGAQDSARDGAAAQVDRGALKQENDEYVRSNQARQRQSSIGFAYPEGRPRASRGPAPEAAQDATQDAVADPESATAAADQEGPAVDAPGREGGISFEEFLRERARFAAARELEEERRAAERAPRLDDATQRELEELRRYKAAVEAARAAEAPPRPAAAAAPPRDPRPPGEAVPGVRDEVAENQRENSRILQQNKRANQESTQVSRNLNPVDVNNPRYRMYKDVDSQYTALQIQLQDNKTELNTLYSHRITRREQLRINFLEQRIRELENDAGRLRAQLKIFEREFL